MQYQWVRESRQVLFDYCKRIAPKDFVDSNSAFGRGGSMRNLLVHIANTYEFWIADQVLKKNVVFTQYDAKGSIGEVISLFDFVDGIMEEFIEALERSGMCQIDYEVGGKKASTDPLKLFTHVITHEFHHKGQILTLSRHLGYIPVDTDIMR